MITFEDGLIITCLLPRFSSLYMHSRASFKTLTLTILREPTEVVHHKACKEDENIQRLIFSCSTAKYLCSITYGVRASCIPQTDYEFDMQIR